MLSWLMNNIGTIIIAAVILGVVCAVVVKLVNDKKKGSMSCGCGCANCAMSASCHNDSRCK